MSRLDFFPNTKLTYDINGLFAIGYNPQIVDFTVGTKNSIVLGFFDFFLFLNNFDKFKDYF